MAKKSGTEAVLAQCYLRYEKGKGDPRHHAYVTQSKLFLRKNEDDYEIYSLKHIQGVCSKSTYLWPFILLGILLIISGLVNGKAGFLPTDRPLRYYFNTQTQAYEEVFENPQDWEVANKKWDDDNETWTYGLFIGGVILVLTGLKKRSSLHVLMSSRELKFKVYMVTPEYNNFVKVFKDALD